MDWIYVLAAVCLLGIVNPARADEVTTSTDAPDMEEVVVTGLRTGPRLWRVSKNGHVLWVLGVLDPLPKDLEWQSQQVSSVLAESQSVLLDGIKISPDANLFAKVGLYLRWRRQQKLPDQQGLQQVLPPDLYARFSVLKQRYAKGDNDLERLRPILAASKLYQAAIDHIGLSARGAVTHEVAKQAKQRGIDPYTVNINVSNPRDLLDSVSHISIDSEIRCLAATLSRLESDLHELRERANAWALGDVATLRALMDSDSRVACWDVLTSVPSIKELAMMAEREWLAAAETSLQRNQSTLALRGIRDLLGANGVLEQLRTQGYEVTGP